MRPESCPGNNFHSVFPTDSFPMFFSLQHFDAMLRKTIKANAFFDLIMATPSEAAELCQSLGVPTYLGKA